MANFSSLIYRLNVVKQIPVFEKLNWFDLQKIARKATVVECRKGDIISKEGNPPDFFFCLVSGRLQAYTESSDGKKENVDFIHRGMHFGIISVLTGENHSMSFEAINDSVVLKIAKDDFQEILKSIPRLGLELSEHLSRRIRRRVKGGSAVFESTVISIYSPVKGTGSSTYAANLALNLQKETGKKVVYINIASKGNVAAKATTVQDNIAPRWKTAAIELQDIVDDHVKIMECVTRGELSVDLLNVMFDPEDASLKDAIGSFVSAFVEDYHYVVVDLPNEMDEVVLEAMTQSDAVHLITSDRRKDLDLIRHEVDSLEAKLRERFSEEKIRVIIRAFQGTMEFSLEEISKIIDYSVYGVLPLLKKSELTQHIDCQSLTFKCSHVRSDYAKAVKHIARQVGEVSIGLALGGGAALGVAHIGVLKVLEEEDIPIDMIVGSSMGALIAALWAIGNNADQVAEIAREFKSPIAKLKLADPSLIPISGIIGGQAIKRWLKKHYGNRTFYDVKVPLKVIAYDLVRREDIVIEGGSITDAVLKSSAIPGVVKPIKENGQLVIDGGVLNPLPTDVLASRGIKKIIAVNVLQSPQDTSKGVELAREELRVQRAIPFHKDPIHFIKFRVSKALFKIFTPNISDIIIQTLQASEYVISEQNAQQSDVLIHPDLVGIKWYELDKVDELIKRGEEATRKLLPEIRKLISD